MSRIDNATLQLKLTQKSTANSSSLKVRVYAVNYNVLRIMSGMGGLKEITKLLRLLSNQGQKALSQIWKNSYASAYVSA
jgi:hypothetical protein